jgi:hypothetical protein
VQMKALLLDGAVLASALVRSALMALQVGLMTTEVALEVAQEAMAVAEEAGSAMAPVTSLVAVP